MREAQFRRRLKENEQLKLYYRYEEELLGDVGIVQTTPMKLHELGNTRMRSRSRPRPGAA